MTALTEGTPASSRPMSRVARKLAESSEEIPATAGLSLPALQGDACVPPTKALPSVSVLPNWESVCVHVVWESKGRPSEGGRRPAARDDATATQG